MNKTEIPLTWLEYTVDEDKKARATTDESTPIVHIIAALRTLGFYEDDLLEDLIREPMVFYYAKLVHDNYKEVTKLLNTVKDSWPHDLADFADASARLSVAAVEAHDDHNSLLRAVKNTFVTMGLISEA